MSFCDVPLHIVACKLTNNSHEAEVLLGPDGKRCKKCNPIVIDLEADGDIDLATPAQAMDLDNSTTRNSDPYDAVQALGMPADAGGLEPFVGGSAMEYSLSQAGRMQNIDLYCGVWRVGDLL